MRPTGTLEMFLPSLSICRSSGQKKKHGFHSSGVACAIFFGISFLQGAVPQSIEIIDGNDSRIVFTGPWINLRGRNQFGDSITLTRTGGATASLEFKGLFYHNSLLLLHLVGFKRQESEYQCSGRRELLAELTSPLQRTVLTETWLELTLFQNAYMKFSFNNGSLTRPGWPTVNTSLSSQISTTTIGIGWIFCRSPQPQ